MVEAEVREWVCWILLVRLMFVLFLGLLLMWYWCVQATLCVFSWRVRISLCNFKRCDILGLNTKSPRSSSATVSALRGIPASCAREFASEFSAGVFPFVPPKPGIFVMQTSSSVSFSFFWVDFFGIPLKVGFLYPSLVIWNDSIGYFSHWMTGQKCGTYSQCDPADGGGKKHTFNTLWGKKGEFIQTYHL